MWMTPCPDWFRDTDPQMLELYIRRVRTMTPGEKLAQAFDLAQLIIGLSEADVRATHPEASPREVRLLAAERRYGKELIAPLWRL